MRYEKFAILLICALPACGTTMRSVAYSGGPAPLDPAPSRHLSPAASRVMVTPQDNLGRKLDVLAVLDFHTRADSEDKGFDELREKAAALGADAVVGAQFEHGEGSEPSHLSGMAVKYGVDDPRPFDVLGEIDIATPEDDDDKGFDRLRAQAAKLGADEVRDIEFDHGAEGGKSHLKGRAVRHRSM